MYLLYAQMSVYFLFVKIVYKIMIIKRTQSVVFIVLNYYVSF
jgi:hypothetical protein